MLPARGQLAVAAGAILALLILVVPATASPGDTVLASRADGASGAPLEGSDLSLSAEGRLVAFATFDNRIGDKSQVLVRDMATGRTSAASRGSAPGGQLGTDHSYLPRVSANGRFVVFLSDADNLSAADDNSARNLFMHDLATAATVYLAPVAPSQSGSLHHPSISSDGRRVAFVSEISGLTGERDSPGTDAFVIDLPSRRLQLVSRASGSRGQPGEAWSTNAVISADGKVVAFASPSLNLAAGVEGVVKLLGVYTFIRDLSTQRTSQLVDGGYLDDAGAVTDLALSWDGRFVTVAAYTDLGAAPHEGPVQVFAHDRRSRSTTVASRAPGAAGQVVGYPFAASSIAADGRLVSFLSEAPVLGARAGAPQLFARDLATGVTFPVSRGSGAGGRLASGGVFSAALSTEGRFAAFSTRDASLDPRAPPSSPFGSGYRRELGPLPPDAVSPRVDRLRLSRRRVRVPRRPGRTGRLVVSYELTELAKVRISLQRRARSVARGRRRRRCLARRRRNPPERRTRRAACGGYRTVASFHDQAAWGPRRLLIRIRRRRREPRAGHYRVLLLATDRAGNRSAPRAARVVLVRR